MYLNGCGIQLTYQAPDASSGVEAGAAVRGARVFPTASGTMPPSAATTRVFVFCAPSRRVGSFGPFEEQVTWVLISSLVFLQYSCLLRTDGEQGTRTLFSPSIYSPISHRTFEPDAVEEQVARVLFSSLVFLQYSYLLRTSALRSDDATSSG